MIDALSKGKSKYLRSLRRRKMRFQLKRFILEGEKICTDLIEHFPQTIEYLIASEAYLATHNLDTVFLSEKLIQATTAELALHSELENPPPIMAIAKMPNWNFPTQPKGKWVFLDAIQDPGNMGTIFRTLSWFGIEGLILGPGCVDPYNPKVLQSSMGGIFHIPHYFASLEETITKLGTPDLMGLDLQGTSLFDTRLPAFGLLILGSEGQGLSQAAREKVNHWLHIPKGNEAKMESLNAGIALGIAVAHWVNQS